MQLSINDYTSDTGLKAWISAVGGTDAPIPRRNLGAALRFFAERMPTLPLADALGFVAAMDLSKPVDRVYLQPGERLLGYRLDLQSPFKLFFARRGSTPQSLGINTEGRRVVHFVVNAHVLALESFTSATIDTWTPAAPGQALVIAPRARKWFGREFGVLVHGGSRQLIIPESSSHLLVEQTDARAP